MSERACTCRTLYSTTRGLWTEVSIYCPEHGYRSPVTLKVRVPTIPAGLPVKEGDDRPGDTHV